jgi:hypothetical protein
LDLRRAAQRARIISERRFRPSAVMPPLRFFELEDLPPELAFAPLDLDELADVLEPAFRRAQRAFAAAASFARVAADIGRRRPSVFVALADVEEPEELPDAAVLLEPPLLPPPVKSELSRSSRD